MRRGFVKPKTKNTRIKQQQQQQQQQNLHHSAIILMPPALHRALNVHGRLCFAGFSVISFGGIFPSFSARMSV